MSPNQWGHPRSPLTQWQILPLVFPIFSAWLYFSFLRLSLPDICLWKHIVGPYEYCQMNEWMSEWALAYTNSYESTFCSVGFFLLGWRDIHWPPVVGPSHRRGLLYSTSLQGAGSESKALPKPLRSRSWWRARLDGKDWGFCGHGRHLQSWKRDRATSQGRPKTKPSPIIICRVCCPRFVEDLPGLISSRETVMCVSNYSFKSKHYLYQRALRRLLRGL